MAMETQQEQSEREQADEHEAARGVRILINQTPFRFEKTTLEPKDFREKVKAPEDYEVWKIVKDADAEGKLPVDDIQITGPVTVKSGDRFRVVPPGTFGAR
jgi:hypothetical protein